MGSLALRRLKGRPTVFGITGLLCLGTMLMVVRDLSPSFLLLGLTLSFIVVSVAVLAVWAAQTALAFGVLWVLALILFAGYFAGTGVTDGFLVTAFAATVFGSLAFAAWLAVGLALDTARRRPERP